MINNEIVGTVGYDDVVSQLGRVLEEFNERMAGIEKAYDDSLKLAEPLVKAEWSSRHAMQKRWMAKYSGRILSRYGEDTTDEEERQRRVFSLRNNWLFNKFVSSDYYDIPDIQKVMTDDGWDTFFEFALTLGDEEISKIMRGDEYVSSNPFLYSYNNHMVVEMIHSMFLDHVEDNIGRTVSDGKMLRKRFVEVYDNIKALGLDSIEIGERTMQMVRELDLYFRVKE